MDVQLGTVKTDRFEMDYCCFGHGGKTLAIIPGISVQSVMPSAEAIAEQYRSLTDDFTIYVFDRRKTVPESYSIKDMAEDTAEAIRALGLEKVSIFGASQGGMIAASIAAADPGLAEKIVLCSTADRPDDHTDEVFGEWGSLAKEGRAEDLYITFGEKVYPANVFEQIKDMFVQAAGTVTSEELARFIVILESLKDFDLTKAIGEIECPVLLVASRDDAIFGPEIPERMAGIIKDCELYMYDGFGHGVYDTAPDFAERMLAFLTK